MHSISIQFSVCGGPSSSAPRAPAKADILRAGDLVDGVWRIEREIGKGGMGIVYAARHESTGQRAAIKVMSDVSLRDPKMVARFEREMRIAMKLKGAHVAQVRAAGRLPSGHPMIVMELLDGEDLGAFVRRHGPLRGEDAIGWTIQACEAVAEAHEAGFVHRDLKLANLFLAQTTDGSSTLKVLDFGLAKATKRSPEDGSLTGAETFLGTPHYMAPEMFMCARDVDARADVWALGVCLYRMVTGVHPFESASVYTLCAHVLNSAPTPATKHCPTLSPALEAIIMRCLARDPSARFANARELGEALSALVSHDRKRPQRPVNMSSRRPPCTLTRVMAARPCA